jgi:metallophosphoesterase (TIGR03768 family)
MTRRSFLRSSASVLACVAVGPLATRGVQGAPAPERYPIDPEVRTTLDRMISFPRALSPGLAKDQLDQIQRYAELGYGEWTFGAGLPLIRRTDLLPNDSVDPAGRISRLARFFSISDIHTTDKEAPNQLIDFQRREPAAVDNTSIYSGVILYSTQVLDAAIQTVNALHRTDRFDFGISLGDTCNSTSYNELRWYIDVLDGGPINPSSGAHAGADTVDYQKPFLAAGLDRDIPWYQVLGNHDHFLIGSFPVDAEPTLGFREAYTADSVWAIGNALVPQADKFPALFDFERFRQGPLRYPGVIDGLSPFGTIVGAGDVADPAFAAGPPKVVPDPDRRSLTRSEWGAEFFDTTSSPIGHGFHLVDRNDPAWDSDGFACYSFLPDPKIPLKIIVLDITQSEHDGSKDIHGHGYLDRKRWAWLRSELAKGQAGNQLMIVAAHIPIGVSAIGSETEWWQGDDNTKPGYENAVDLAGLVEALQDTPNLILWIAGHRHLNTVKAFRSPDPARPELGFWQVETSSLRDFPQQFRTFEIVLNDDDTVSVVTLNVDPAVAEASPAANSRRYAIAAQQIIGNDLRINNPNYRTAGGSGGIPVPPVDPTRPQSDDPSAVDPTIQFVDLSGADPPVPYHASCNAELLKPLSPAMSAVLRKLFPH